MYGRPAVDRVSVDTSVSNLTIVHFGDLTLWFSYKTLVAFQRGDMRPMVRENDWGPTTGKHLNMIDGGKRRTSQRLAPQDFDEEFERVMSSIDL